MLFFLFTILNCHGICKNEAAQTTYKNVTCANDKLPPMGHEDKNQRLHIRKCLI